MTKVLGGEKGNYEKKGRNNSLFQSDEENILKTIEVPYLDLKVRKTVTLI